MNKYRNAVILVALSIAVAGCVMQRPMQPSVRVLPGRYAPFELYVADDQTCRSYAAQQYQASQPQGIGESAATSGVVGGLIGAAGGAIIGAVVGDPGAGAAIGGVIGGLSGAAGGAQAGQVAAMTMQQRFDHDFVACMWSKNHIIPGAYTMSR